VITSKAVSQGKGVDTIFPSIVTNMFTIFLLRDVFPIKTEHDNGAALKDYVRLHGSTNSNEK
jgi:hypothetical protein